MQQGSMLSLRGIWDEVDAKQTNAAEFSSSFYDNTVQEVSQRWGGGTGVVFTRPTGQEEQACTSHAYHNTHPTPGAPRNARAQYAQQPVEQLSLRQMLEFGRSVRYERDKVLTSARYVQRELPKRLARRLLDLQFLPHIVVRSPSLLRVV